LFPKCNFTKGSLAPSSGQLRLFRFGCDNDGVYNLQHLPVLGIYRGHANPRNQGAANPQAPRDPDSEKFRAEYRKMLIAKVKLLSYDEFHQRGNNGKIP
jgi:hypothetical protein